MKKTLLYIFALVFTLEQSFACTAITLKGKDGVTVAARTMDWAFDWDWKLIYYPKRTSQFLTSPYGDKTEYKSTYSVLGLAIVEKQKGVSTLFDGQNSAGLSVSANYFPGYTKYQEVKKTDKYYVSVSEYITFLLSKYDTIENVKVALEKYKLWGGKSIIVHGIEPHLHFLISDKSGRSLIVEYMKDKVRFYIPKNKVQVLTNSPSYAWHTTNIKNYLGVSTNNSSNMDIFGNNDKLLKNLGQGYGFQGLPSDYSPPSRFVRATVLSYFSYKNNKDEPSLNKTAHLLHAFDIPKGVVVENVNGMKIMDHVVWTVFKDLKNNVMYLNSYNDTLNSASISLDDLDRKHTKEFIKSVKRLPYPTPDITNKL